VEQEGFAIRELLMHNYSAFAVVDQQLQEMEVTSAYIDKDSLAKSMSDYTIAAD
jgi:hypothetical protein